MVRFATINNLWTSDTTNNAGLFGVGDGTTTMVLPNWVARMAQFSNDAGASIEAGLPNITGGFACDSGAPYYYLNNITGAFQGNGSGQTNTSAGSGGLSRNKTVDFDASRSSAIYGASTTVQPPAIKVLPVLRY